METILPYVAQAVGGVIGGNILGLVTRGGGGHFGRTIIGAIAGLAAGYAASAVPEIGAVTANWATLTNSDLDGLVSNAITGAAGGGVIGLITGLLLRPRG